MNLNNHPTATELSALLASVDDNADHHCLWVDHQGEVHLTPVEQLEGCKPQMRMRLEIYCQGNDYVGAAVAKDHDYVEKLLVELIRAWPDAMEDTGPEPYFFDH